MPPQQVANGLFFWSRSQLGLPDVDIPQASGKTEFIGHHSGGEVLGRSDFVKWWQQIDNQHREQWDGPGVGYNFGIASAGDVLHILEGRSWRGIGAHTIGHNTSGLGVCYLRSRPAHDNLKRGILWLYEQACKREKRALRKMCHADVYETACAGDLNDWYHSGMPQPKGGDNVSQDQCVAACVAPSGRGTWKLDRDGAVRAFHFDDKNPIPHHGSMFDVPNERQVPGRYYVDIQAQGDRDEDGYYIIANDNFTGAFPLSK